MNNIVPILFLTITVIWMLAWSVNAALSSKVGQENSGFQPKISKSPKSELKNDGQNPAAVAPAYLTPPGAFNDDYDQQPDLTDDQCPDDQCPNGNCTRLTSELIRDYLRGNATLPLRCLDRGDVLTIENGETLPGISMDEAKAMKKYLLESRLRTTVPPNSELTTNSAVYPRNDSATNTDEINANSNSFDWPVVFGAVLTGFILGFTASQLWLKFCKKTTSPRQQQATSVTVTIEETPNLTPMNEIHPGVSTRESTYFYSLRQFFWRTARYGRVRTGNDSYPDSTQHDETNV